MMCLSNGGSSDITNMILVLHLWFTLMCHFICSHCYISPPFSCVHLCLWCNVSPCVYSVCAPSCPSQFVLCFAFVNHLCSTWAPYTVYLCYPMVCSQFFVSHVFTELYFVLLSLYVLHFLVFRLFQLFLVNRVHLLFCILPPLGVSHLGPQYIFSLNHNTIEAKKTQKKQSCEV